MEPNEFDKLINDKLSQKNDLYHKEISDSQPFVWGEIQKKMTFRVLQTRWYVTVAATLLCILLIPIFCFRYLENQYTQNLEQIKLELTQKITQQKDQEATSKFSEREQLCLEIDHLKQELYVNEKVQITSTKQIIIQTEIVREVVYIRDTIYLKPGDIPTSTKQLVQNEISEKSSQKESIENQVSELIYPDYKPSNPTKKQTQNSIKVIINPFNN